MLDPEKDLGGQTKSQSHSGNLCSGEAFRERIFDILVKTGDCDILRDPKSALFQKLEQDTAHMVVGTDEGIGHFRKAVEEALDFFFISIDTDGSGQGHGRIQREAMIIQGFQKSVITLVVGFCIGDITNEAEGMAALLDHMTGDLVYTVLVLHEDHIAVQLLRRYRICRIQKDLGDPGLGQQMEKPLIVYIKHDHSVGGAAGEGSRKDVSFIDGGGKIHIDQIDVPVRELLLDLVADGQT